uniref:Uncharacterized protein n=1 Tax=Vespula pensylvanica TaxID=30213 RepID=A0A834NSN4_VESPE|nr:hypothetical protein H0235_011764 [Vespula pensylvanica]
MIVVARPRKRVRVEGKYGALLASWLVFLMSRSRREWLRGSLLSYDMLEVTLSVLAEQQRQHNGIRSCQAQARCNIFKRSSLSTAKRQTEKELFGTRQFPCKSRESSTRAATTVEAVVEAEAEAAAAVEAEEAATAAEENANVVLRALIKFAEGAASRLGA